MKNLWMACCQSPKKQGWGRYGTTWMACCQTKMLMLLADNRSLPRPCWQPLFVAR